MDCINITSLCRQQGILATLLLTFMILASCIANQMDPHVFPKAGPFFEGWYLRIVDHHQNVSLGFMFGHVLPSATLAAGAGNPCSVPDLELMTTDCKRQIVEKRANPFFSEFKYINITRSPHPVFVGLLLSLDKHGKLDNPAGYFSPSEYNITIDGKPVNKNPDDESPPNFEARIAHNFSLVVNSKGTWFSVKVGHHVLQGETTRPVPWGPKGEGPESWLEKLPLPFHWFVYSLRSVVKSYKYVNTETGKIVNGSSGQGVSIVAHLEKNWGNSFPKAWVWSEGVNPRSTVSFAFSAGLVTLVGFDIKAQLSGYRNVDKQINCNFSPSNSFHSLRLDGCTGTVILKVEGLACSVIFQVTAAPESFSSCIAAPMKYGFTEGCVESFEAVANITVYQRHSLSWILTDIQVVHLSALEFGEAYMCNGQCPG